MTQKQALKIMNSGANVFLTGPPGSGKTYVLNEFIQNSSKEIAITASTGMAASHIGGYTIHSWSGIGILDMIDKQDLQKIKDNGRTRKRIMKAQVLIIDEVSMLHGSRLDMVNIICKSIRGNKLPFGGLQVILVGDLFQLPPVSRETTELDFVHLSTAWESLDLKVCYLTEQHRQAGNDPLLNFLISMRKNAFLEEDFIPITQRRMVEAPDNVTKLYSHNIDVDAINQQHLDALPGDSRFYNMIVDGDKFLRETIKRNVLAPEKLELKAGAEVMFVANNFDAHFFNGSRGVVEGFNKKNKRPVVKMANGRKIEVEPHTWSIKEGERELASVTQTPLRLAWAITIHKSQGMTLDAAEIDLSKAFMPGMGYVALSRVKSLDGLYLKGLNDMALVMHEQIYEFDIELRAASEDLVK